MGTRQLRIIPYTGKRAYQYYIDGLKVNGKRQRLFFKDANSAKAKLKELTKKTRKEGEDALALSHDFRVLAAKCSERLKPFGKTLWDATEFYLEHLERTKDSVFVSSAAADYQESKKRAKLSPKHLDDIRLRLGRFVATFGNRPIKGIVAGEIESWLHEMALSPVLRLEWSDVDLVRGFVTVAAHKSKTARRRLIPVSQNLAEWLRPYAQISGPVYSTKTRNYHADIEALRSSIGLSTWPNNGLRHSFASYHLAKHQNAPQLALEMGHSTPRMIFDNYREVVAPAEAERYWTINPNINADNVVRLSTAI